MIFWILLGVSIVGQAVLIPYSFIGPWLTERRRARASARPARVDFEQTLARVRRGEGVFVHNLLPGLAGALWYVPPDKAGSWRSFKSLIHRGDAVQVEGTRAEDVAALAADPLVGPRLVTLAPFEHSVD